MKKISMLVVFIMALGFISAHAEQRLGQDGDKCNSSKSWCYPEGIKNCEPCKEQWRATHPGPRTQKAVAAGAAKKAGDKKSQTVDIKP